MNWKRHLVRTCGALSMAASAVLPPTPFVASVALAQDGPARFSSVCIRNAQKIQDEITRSGLRHYAAIYDLWVIPLNETYVRLYASCAAFDPRAAQMQKRASDYVADIRRHCAGQPASHDCLQWGSSYQEANRRYYALWEQEARKALSDPNYSASLGPAAGPGGGATTPSGGTAPRPEELCQDELRRLGQQMTADEARLRPDATVGRMELILWYTDATGKAIERLCPQADAYADQRETFRRTHQEVLTTCNALATRPCAPRRP